MSRRDLDEQELRSLSAWASTLTDRHAADQVHRLIGEVRELRERESVVRHLNAIEGEV